MIDLVLVSISRDRYNEMLQEAAAERRARAIEAYGRPVEGHLLARVGDFLIAAGQKLKTRYQTERVTPVFR